jgi:hypothetical protein
MKQSEPEMVEIIKGCTAYYEERYLLEILICV